MKSRVALLAQALALIGCQGHPPRQSLVGDGAAPGTYALAGDTITVWKRMRQPDGAWRFQSWSITPDGTVERLEELERVGAPENPEEVQDFSEQRQGFALAPADFEAIRSQAALLRPASLGPADPVGGYGGEVYPKGCAPDAAGPRVAGIRFLNAANWGDFVLQLGCGGGSAAAGVMTQVFDRLDRAALQAASRPR